jgi:hypothetical protein
MLLEETGNIGYSVFNIIFEANQKPRNPMAIAVKSIRTFKIFFHDFLLTSLNLIFEIKTTYSKISIYLYIELSFNLVLSLLSRCKYLFAIQRLRNTRIKIETCIHENVGTPGRIAPFTEQSIWYVKKP